MKGNKPSLPTWLSSLCRAEYYYIGSRERRILYSWMGSISQISEIPKRVSRTGMAGAWFWFLLSITFGSSSHTPPGIQHWISMRIGHRRREKQIQFTIALTLLKDFGVCTLLDSYQYKNMVFFRYSILHFTFFVPVGNKITTCLHLKQS